MPRPRLVILESPYAGDVDANVAYARRALADSLRRGEAPIASHLLYTQPGVLDDGVPAERQLGIAAGLAWATVAEATVVYVDRGISAGMRLGVGWADSLGRPVEVRRIGDNAPVAAITPTAEERPVSLSPRHWALAAEAVTDGPMLERDIVQRVAQALADAEQRGADGVEVWYCNDCAEPGDSPHLADCPQNETENAPNPASLREELLARIEDALDHEVYPDVHRRVREIRDNPRHTDQLLLALASYVKGRLDPVVYRRIIDAAKAVTP